MDAHTESEAEPAKKRVLLMVEWVPNGVRVSHCRASDALVELAETELIDRSPANLLEIGIRQLQEWVIEYGHGAWSRGVKR